jgi:hypothetical protein
LLVCMPQLISCHHATSFLSFAKNNIPFTLMKYNIARGICREEMACRVELHYPVDVLTNSARLSTNEGISTT